MVSRISSACRAAVLVVVFCVVSLAVSPLAKGSDSADLAWGSFLGGSGEEDGYAIALDKRGNAYVTGETSSLDFPIVGVKTTRPATAYSIFVSCVTTRGKLAWSTVLPGSPLKRRTTAEGIAVDKSGDIWIVGRTNAADFPTPGGFSTAPLGGYDAYVLRFNSRGILKWGSRIGGSGSDRASGITLDAKGNAWIVGHTSSPDFPVPGGFQQELTGESAAFVVKVTRQGTLAWGSYLSGSATIADWAYSVAVAPDDSVWVCGATDAPDFPTPGGFNTTFNTAGMYEGATNGFLVKIVDGQLMWGTFLDKSDRVPVMDGAEYADRVAIDKDGNVVVNLEVLGLPSEGIPNANTLMKISPLGELLWTLELPFIGGSLAVDDAGNAWLGGWQTYDQLPTPGGFDTVYREYDDQGYICKVSSAGELLWGSYIAGRSYFDGCRAIAADGKGNVWLAGTTRSTDFSVPGGFDVEKAVDDDCYVLRIVDEDALFSLNGPADAESFTADAPATFSFSYNPSIRPVYIAFSYDKTFPRTGPAGRTLRLAVPRGATSWTPTGPQWKAIAKTALADGTVYWRMEGSMPDHGIVYGRTRSLIIAPAPGGDTAP